MKESAWDTREVYYRSSNKEHQVDSFNLLSFNIFLSHLLETLVAFFLSQQKAMTQAGGSRASWDTMAMIFWKGKGKKEFRRMGSSLKQKY